MTPLVATHRLRARRSTRCIGIAAVLVALTLPLVGTLACTSAPSSPKPNAVEAPTSTSTDLGSYALYKLEQRIGSETCETRPDADAAAGSTLTTVSFQFVDRGATVALTSTLREESDGTPISFAIHGTNARSIGIDAAVDVRDQRIDVRQDEEKREAARPARFFTIAGYAPFAMQRLLLRYWLSHGSPSELATFPSGSVRITRRGRDVLDVRGVSKVLDRYSIEGLVWGRETVWMDEREDLVAAVTLDAEFDHFEAVREEFAPALGVFVAKAASDGMAALATLAEKLPGERAPRLAIVGGRMIDGTGASPLDDSVVLIDGGKITAVGRRGDVTIPSDARVVDAIGKSIVPGLWDMHAHFEQVEWGPIYLAAGVTTVRDCGNELEFITSIRDAIGSRKGLGPRILAAGIVDGSGPRAIGVQRVDSASDALEKVQRYHDEGFQQIKIYSSMKLENLAAVAHEAHRLGMTVTGHVPRGVTMEQAIEAGQDQVNHIHYVFDAIPVTFSRDVPVDQLTRSVEAMDVDGSEARGVIEFLREHHTVVDPTIALFELRTVGPDRPIESFEPGAARVAPELAAAVHGISAPPGELRLSRAFFAKDLALVGALHRAGVPIVAGTDQAIPGHSLHRELELYVEAGFTPLEAIQSATIVPARAMKLERELGTIEVGRRADLILVDGDPSRDIHDIRKVRSVVTDGVLYECAPLWRAVGFAP